MTTIRADDVDLARDRALVERFQTGDDTAFEELFRRYFDRLRRFCERRVGDRDSAEEIAQEAFARALAGLPGFSGERRFYPWMTVIARRLCVDRHRERARSSPQPLVDDLAAAARAAPDGDASDPVMLRTDLEALDRALARVRDRHREVLRLREWEGLSYQDIARQLEVPVTTVEALLHRARHAVRREFLSVADAARGILVALGGAAALARTWGRRAATRAVDVSHAAPGAAGVVLAGLGAAVLVAGPAEHPSPEAERPPPPVARRAEARPPAVPAGRARPASPAGAAPGDPADPPAAPEPDARVGTVDVYLGPEGSGEAADESDDLPVNEDVGPAFVGLDPPEVVGDVRAALPETTGGPLP